MASQHGGPNLPGNASDPNSAQNKLYQHYNQQHMRPGYPQGPRASMGPMPQRPTSMMPCYPPSANGGAPPQRFLSGPSLSQQGGPTPTLNQLLQSPNPLHRYQNSYGEYNSNPAMHKADMAQAAAAAAAQYPTSVGSPHSWAGSARGSSPYPQQISAPMYRPPVGGGMHESGAGGPASKRPYLAGPGQYPQYPQRHPYPGQPRPSMAQGYTQQQMAAYPSGPQTPQSVQQQQQQQQQGASGGPPPSPAPSPHSVQQERPTPPPQGSASPVREGPPSRQGTPNSHPSGYGGYPSVPIPQASSSSAQQQPPTPTSSSSSTTGQSGSSASQQQQQSVSVIPFEISAEGRQWGWTI